MIPTFNSLNPFYYPFAGALGTVVVSNAPVLLGAEALGSLLGGASAEWGFYPSSCGNPTNLAGLPQLAPVDKMVLPSTGPIGGVDGKPELGNIRIPYKR